MLAEAAVRASGLPYALFRLGGVMSPDTLSEYQRRLPAPDALDAGRQPHAHGGRAGCGAGIRQRRRSRKPPSTARRCSSAGTNPMCMLQREMEDDMMSAVGLGRLGPSASLPGDPDDDRGWSFTGWFDTTESQALLDFQEHDWDQTRGLDRRIARPPAHRFTRARPDTAAGAASPPLKLQQRAEGRGPYADPWTLIEKKYGPAALAQAD